jgi:PGF-pre-PGF domain-containing protein
MKINTKVIAICTLIILFGIVIQVQSSLAETDVTPEQFMDLIKAKIDFYSFPRIGQANVWTRDTVMTQYYDENSGYVIYLYVNKDDGSVRRVEFQRYNKPVNSISGNVASIALSKLRYKPTLSINPDPPSNDFGTVPEGQTRLWDFRITNGGGGTLSWSASADQSWIAVSPESGTTTTGENTVTVIIDTQGLSQGRTYRGYVSVSSNGESKKGTISVTIPALTQEPKLCINPDLPSNDFGTVPENQIRSWDFSVENCGGNTLTWSTSTDQPWITVNPKSGITTIETDLVTVTIDSLDMSPRTYTGHVTVSSNGGSKTGTIAVTIPALTQEPKLCINPDPPSNDFGTVPEKQIRSWNFSVENCGGNTLTWSTSTDQPWIMVNPKSGTTTIDSDTVTVAIDTYRLSPGSYTGHVTVSSNGGNNTGTISANLIRGPPSETVQIDSNGYAIFKEIRTVIRKIRFLPGSSGNVTITEKLNFSKSYYVIIAIKVPKNLKNSSGDICFQAKKEWLKRRDCRNEDVELYRKDDNDGWVPLGANWQTTEGEYVQYEANTFAFSEFKIDLVKNIEDIRRERDRFWVMIAGIVIGVVIGVGVPIIISKWRQSLENGGNNPNKSGGEAKEEDVGNKGEKEKIEKNKGEESKGKSEEKSSDTDK